MQNAVPIRALGTWKDMADENVYIRPSNLRRKMEIKGLDPTKPASIVKWLIELFDLIPCVPYKKRFGGGIWGIKKIADREILTAARKIHTAETGMAIRTCRVRDYWVWHVRKDRPTLDYILQGDIKLWEKYVTPEALSLAYSTDEFVRIQSRMEKTLDYEDKIDKERLEQLKRLGGPRARKKVLVPGKSLEVKKPVDEFDLSNVTLPELSGRVIDIKPIGDEDDE